MSVGRSITALLIGCLSLVSTAAGFGRGNYASAAFQFGAVGALPGPRHGDVCNSTVYHVLFGGQAEYGWFGDVWMLYLGYNHSQAIDREDHDDQCGTYYFSSHDHRKWALNQFTIGARLHVTRDAPNPIKPLIGVAGTFGWACYTAKFSESNPQGSFEEIDTYGTSKGGAGILFEAGTLIGPIHRVTPFVIAYAHLFTAEFGRKIPYAESGNTDMSGFGVRAGAQLSLKCSPQSNGH